MTNAAISPCNFLKTCFPNEHHHILWPYWTCGKICTLTVSSQANSSEDAETGLCNTLFHLVARRRLTDNHVARSSGGIQRGSKECKTDRLSYQKDQI